MNTPILVPNSIKIVRIFSRLNIGGPSLQVVLLSDQLPSSYQTILVTGNVSKEEGNMSYVIPPLQNFKHVLIPELGRNIHFAKDVIAFWKILKLLWKEKPHIVHTHTAKAGILGRSAAFLARVPIRIHTFHGHVFSNYFGPLKSRLIIYIERILALLTTHIIAISLKQKEDLVNRYKIASEKKVILVPLGFDLTVFEGETSDKEHIKKEFHLPLQKPYLVGMVGRLVPIKNHMLFLKVAKKIILQRQDVHFLIVGDGECFHSLQKTIQALELNMHVTILGWQRKLKPIYDILDVVCLTSLNEGTPVSLIEAQACGKAVVATAVGGIEDVVFSDKNGYVVSLDTYGDKEYKFAEKILFLLDHPEEREAMQQFGRKFVQKNFNKDRLLKDIDHLYQTILKNI